MNKKILLFLFFIFEVILIQTSFSQNTLKVTWYPIKEDLIIKEYNVSVQNLLNYNRDIDIKGIISSANFDLTRISDLKIYEYKNVTKPVKVLNEYIRIYNCSYFDNETLTFLNKKCYEIYHKYDIELKNVLDWKKAKEQAFIKTSKEIKKNLGLINIPKYNSKNNNDGTYNGIKWFKVRFKTPITQTSNGYFGSSGKVALNIDNVEYHPYWNTTYNHYINISFIDIRPNKEVNRYFEPVEFWINVSDFSLPDTTNFYNGTRLLTPGHTQIIPFQWLEGNNVTNAKILAMINKTADSPANYSFYYDCDGTDAKYCSEFSDYNRNMITELESISTYNITNNYETISTEFAENGSWGSIYLTDEGSSYRWSDYSLMGLNSPNKGTGPVRFAHDNVDTLDNGTLKTVLQFSGNSEGKEGYSKITVYNKQPFIKAEMLSNTTANMAYFHTYIASINGSEHNINSSDMIKFENGSTFTLFVEGAQQYYPSPGNWNTMYADLEDSTNEFGMIHEVEKELTTQDVGHYLIFSYGWLRDFASGTLITMYYGIIPKGTNWGDRTNETYEGWIANPLSYSLGNEQVRPGANTAPTFSNFAVNDSFPYKFTHVNMSLNISDDSDIDFYRFSWNDSGSWTNDSWVQPTATTSYQAWTLKEVTSNAGTAIGWKYYVNDSDSAFNSSEIQTFNMGGLEECTSDIGNRAVALNFTFYDEINESSLTEDFKVTFNIQPEGSSLILNRSYDLTSRDYVAFCISPSNSSYYINSTIEYERINYAVRNYYHLNALIDNNTQNIKLYSLPTVDATLITFTVKDELDNTLEDVYIKVQRYNIGTGNYSLIAMGVTDEDGQDHIYLQQNVAFYRFIIERYGILQTLTRKRRIVATSLIIKISPETIADLYDKFDTISYTFGYHNESNSFNITYSDTSGNVEYACLQVFYRTVGNETVLCNKCLYATAGTLDCFIGNRTGTYIASFYTRISGSGLVDKTIKTLTHIIKETTTLALKLGYEGLALSLLFFVSIFFIGIWNPVVAISFALFGIFTLSILGMMTLSYFMVISIIIVGIIVISKLKS